MRLLWSPARCAVICCSNARASCGERETGKREDQITVYLNTPSHLPQYSFTGKFMCTGRRDGQKAMTRARAKESIGSEDWH